jgi:hypothetical protein
MVAALNLANGLSIFSLLAFSNTVLVLANIFWLFSVPVLFLLSTGKIICLFPFSSC